MKIRALAVLAALAISLTGCRPGPEAPSAGPEPSTEASASPSASPALVIAIPGSCEELVPIGVVHEQFAPDFESIPATLVDGGPVAQDFRSRGGLTCVWGIPNSDAGFVSLFVAERATATDAEQVGLWQVEGYPECPPFLDACHYEQVVDDFGEYWNAFILVEGFELRLQATTSSLDPMLVVARAASTSMGYV